MSERQLKKLAKLIFKMTRSDVWLGGKQVYGQEKAKHWPLETFPFSKPKHSREYTWTLSPEVELGNHKIRVCVYHHHIQGREWDKDYYVVVYIDGEIKYPGGKYKDEEWGIFPSWAYKIAKQEWLDGGKTGPVSARRKLIAEAKQKIHTPQVTHTSSTPDMTDPLVEAAVKEVEELVKKHKQPRKQNA